MTKKLSWVTRVLFLAGLCLVPVAPLALSALVDWTRHEEWKKQQIESILEEVKRVGSVPYVMLSLRAYDDNKDGKIDLQESKKLESLVAPAKENKR